MSRPDLLMGLVYYAVFLVATTLHEAAHAWAALRGGDRTAYLGGQVSLDPLPHIRREPFGMVVLPLLSVVLMGWPFGFASAPYSVEWARRVQPAAVPPARREWRHPTARSTLSDSSTLKTVATRSSSAPRTPANIRSSSAADHAPADVAATTWSKPTGVRRGKHTRRDADPDRRERQRYQQQVSPRGRPAPSRRRVAETANPWSRAGARPRGCSSWSRGSRFRWTPLSRSTARRSGCRSTRFPASACYTRGSPTAEGSSTAAQVNDPEPDGIEDIAEERLYRSTAPSFRSSRRSPISNCPVYGSR